MELQQISFRSCFKGSNQSIQICKFSVYKVWEVHIWKIDPTTAEKKVLVSTSRVTLLCNRQAPEDLKGYEQIVKSFAKL